MSRPSGSIGLGLPGLAFQACELGIDSSWVIWMRCMRMAAGGPGSQKEAHRMVAEKWQAQVELTMALATGQLGADPIEVAGQAIDHYHSRVRANRKRLSR